MRKCPQREPGTAVLVTVATVLVLAETLRGVCLLPPDSQTRAEGAVGGRAMGDLPPRSLSPPWHGRALGLTSCPAGVQGLALPGCALP